MTALPTSADDAAAPPLFTIFTATYNRAHTLHRVFDSLRAQTLRNFEWLVIDDGSTDRTGALVECWRQTADFPIRYLRQDHAGKHIAHNRALKEAYGRYFFPVDSDDALVADALERLTRLWNSIPEDEREAFSSVGGLCRDQAGKISGDRFPSDPFDANLRELMYIHRNRGEKWIVGRTDIWRRYPFPQVAGTQFIPEGIFLLDIAKTYNTRWVNEVVRIYYRDDAATGPTLSKRVGLGDSAAGRWHYYVWLLNNDLNYFFHSPTPFLKAAVMLPIVTWLSDESSLRRAMASLRDRPAKILVVLALPFSLLLYAIDRVRTCRLWRPSLRSR